MAASSCHECHSPSDHSSTLNYQRDRNLSNLESHPYLSNMEASLQPSFKSNHTLSRVQDNYFAKSNAELTRQAAATDNNYDICSEEYILQEQLLRLQEIDTRINNLDVAIQNYGEDTDHHVVHKRNTYNVQDHVIPWCTDPLQNSLENVSSVSQTLYEGPALQMKDLEGSQFITSATQTSPDKFVFSSVTRDWEVTSLSNSYKSSVYNSRPSSGSSNSRRDSQTSLLSGVIYSHGKKWQKQKQKQSNVKVELPGNGGPSRVNSLRMDHRNPNSWQYSNDDDDLHDVSSLDYNEHRGSGDQRAIQNYSHLEVATPGSPEGAFHESLLSQSLNSQFYQQHLVPFASKDSESTHPSLVPSHHTQTDQVYSSKTAHHHKRSVDSYIGHVDLDTSVMTFASFHSVDLSESLIVESDTAWKDQFQNGQISDSSTGHNTKEALSFSNPLQNSYNCGVNDALWSFKLFSLLDSSNPIERKNILLKARFFHRWFHHMQQIRREKDRRQRQESRAKTFCKHLVISKYFYFWKNKFDIAQKLILAKGVYRKHLLLKGFRGLKRAAEQTRNSVKIVQRRCQHNIRKTAFCIWNQKMKEQRSYLLFTAFKQWHHFKLQSEKKQTLNLLASRQFLSKFIKLWKTSFKEEQKTNVASLHYKIDMLTKCWHGWRSYTAASLVKHQKNQVAVLHYKDISRRQVLAHMKELYIKFQHAKIYHRQQLLISTFKFWQQETKVIKISHLKHVHLSGKFYKQSCLQSVFKQWKFAYQVKHVTKQRETLLLSRSFEIWLLSWKKRLICNEMNRAQALHNLKYQAFIAWFQNVRLAKAARQRAVIHIQRALIKGVMDDWRHFTEYKIQLMIKLQEHVTLMARRHRKYCFHLWGNQLQAKLSKQNAREMWSVNCVRNAWMKWRHVMAKRKMNRLLEVYKPQAHYYRVLGAFKQWYLWYKRHSKDRERCEWFQNVTKYKRMRNVFTLWRLQVQQSLVVAPLRHKMERGCVAKSFDAWRVVVLRKKLGQERLTIRSRVTIKGCFRKWRETIMKCQKLKSLCARSEHGLLEQCLDGWKLLLKRKKMCCLLQKLTATNLMKHSLKTWKENLNNRIQNRNANNKNHQHNLVSLIFRCWLDFARNQSLENKILIDTIHVQKQTRLLQHCFLEWNRRYFYYQKARRFLQVSNAHKLQCIFRSWYELSIEECNESMLKFYDALQTPTCPRDYLLSPCSLSARSQLSEPFSLREIHPVYNEGDVLNDGQWYSFNSTPRFRAGTNSDMLTDCDLNVTLSDDHGQTLQSLATYMLQRWRHWPVSGAFQQWQQFSLSQQNVKFAIKILCQNRNCMLIRWIFIMWKSKSRKQLTARKYWERCAIKKCLDALLLFVYQEKRIKHMNDLAKQFGNTKTLGSAMICWKQKLEEKHQLNELLGIWHDLSPSKAYYRQYCDTFQKRIETTTLRSCWYMWTVRIAQISEAQKYHNRKYLHRCIQEWFVFANLRQQQKELCQHFRLTNLRQTFFNVWKLCMRQSQQVKLRYVLSWRQHLIVILQKWHHWAAEHCLQRRLFIILSQLRIQSQMRELFLTWKSAVDKQKRAKECYSTVLLSRLFIQWSSYSRKRTKLKNELLQWQKKKNSELVSMSLKLWQINYRLREMTREAKQKQIARYTKNAALTWRQKTLTRRAENFNVYQLAMQTFISWQNKVRLQKEIKKRVLWFGILWKEKAHQCHQREVQADTLLHDFQRSLLQRTFNCWSETLKKAMFAKGHCIEQLKRRVLYSWASAARKHRIQQSLESYQRQKHVKMITGAFKTWKKEFNDIVIAKEIAHHHCEMKNQQLRCSTLKYWQEFVKERRADRHYYQSLTHTSIRIWYNWTKDFKMRMENKMKVERSQYIHLTSRAFLLWKHQLTLQRRMKQLVDRKLKKRLFQNWKNFLFQQQAFSQNKSKLIVALTHNQLNHFFMLWKLRYHKHLQREEEVDSLIGRRNFILMHIVLHHWRISAHNNKADGHFCRNVLSSAFILWRERACKQQLETSLTEAHYEIRLCHRVLLVWKEETEISRLNKKRQLRLMKSCVNKWRTIIRKQTIACEWYKYKIYNSVWRTWTHHLIRAQVSQAVMKQNSRIVAAEVFHAWHKRIIVL